MTCEQWDVAVVPFPFVDAPQTKARPVLIVSGNAFNQLEGHCLAAMITTAKRSEWTGDTAIADLGAAGLAVPSLIRLKFFTLDVRLTVRTLGQLATKDRTRFKKNFERYIL
jgi:mRNA interferase MazF